MRAAPLTVRRASSEDAAAWDQFVNAHPEGRYSHLWGYREALEKAYGYRCVQLQFFSEGQLCGVFPYIKHPRNNGWLISQPFTEYGGPLTGNLTEDQYRELTELMLASAGEEKCRSIEVRGGMGCDAAAQAGGWIRQLLHSYAVLELDDPEKLWKKTVTHEARKGVNKARKSGLTAEVRRGASAVHDPFYQLYLVSMKRLGVPPHSKQFFEHLAAGIGERLVACWVMSGSEPAAILLGATSAQRIHIFVIASDPEAWPRRPSDLAHWELICWAYNQGLRVFDFGSARYGGQIQFKKKWGVSLYDYGFYLIAPPDARSGLKSQTVQTSSKSMAAMSAIWRTAVPLSMTRLIGPSLRRYLTK
jgi:CelD/BcsL family acetyltransferase involved in cellulose biosynthesis